MTYSKSKLSASRLTPDLLTPDPSASDRLGITPAGSDLRAELGNPEPPFVLRHMVAKGGLTIIGGAPKTGKSFVLYEMILAMATGKRQALIDPDGRKARVGLFDLEGVKRDTAKRLDILCTARGMVLEDLDKNVFLFNRRQYTIQDPGCADEIIRVVREGGLDVVAIDTFAKSYGEDENSNHLVGKYLKAIGRIRNETNAAVILVHHMSKVKVGFTAEEMNPTYSLRGASTLASDYDFIIGLQEGYVGRERMHVLMGGGKNTAQYWCRYTMDIQETGETDPDGTPVTEIRSCEYGKKSRGWGTFSAGPGR